jgi:aspartate--ammonia ligase
MHTRSAAPAAYASALSLRETEIAIKLTKDYFERELARQLNLTRVSAPLFVDPETGINDNLNGVERPVSFQARGVAGQLEIIHSLAKWKRVALARYGFGLGEGLYADMNAVRRDEDLDNLHSIYVDQWDWEQVIAPEQRSLAHLQQTVRQIFAVLRDTEHYLATRFSKLQPQLPTEIEFITAQELEDRYPSLTPKEREEAIAREAGAVFLMQIGGKLRSGQRHDGRAPDYDDWQLNGDLLLWYPLLQRSFELSSMGIRVNQHSLRQQLQESGCPERAELPYHQQVMRAELPQTVGGGIGQSRICMFLLQKAHIGEVQASVWPAEMLRQCQQSNIALL